MLVIYPFLLFKMSTRRNTFSCVVNSPVDSNGSTNPYDKPIATQLSSHAFSLYPCLMSISFISTSSKSAPNSSSRYLSNSALVSVSNANLLDQQYPTPILFHNGIFHIHPFSAAVQSVTLCINFSRSS